MRLALNEGRDETEALAWAALPGLCCEAAGGEAAWADVLAAAWIMLQEAASITDNVEDRDPPADWWAQSGSAVALSVATGLYFSACQALNQLEDAPLAPLAARAVRDEMLRRVLEMCSGQYLDLLQPRPALATYWQVARAKSGAFFGMACWAGARLATEEPRTLLGFQEFGVQLGLLIQILDDLKEYQALEQSSLSSGTSPECLPDLRRSLPAAYVREVASPEVVDHFEQLLENPIATPDAGAQIVQTIERFGGAAYVLAELEIKRMKALEGLEISGARLPARDGLLRLLEAVYAPD
ncbi:MAG: polyprenyl synthetase family protein [Anaerolineales bacterium]|nr:polyprenyl synthetase family protein [Anaerolineales bacterium]